MDKLTANEESFIDTMCEGVEYAQRGFELLSKRDDVDRFFDHLRAKMLLAPNNNKAPEPAGQPGSFRIPYWPGLDYLVAVAKKADNEHDLAMAAQVVEVVVAATRRTDESGNPIDNYHTYRQFAVILATLPIDAVTDDLVNLVPVWLSSRFDTGLVGSELGSKAIPRLLSSNDKSAIEKACQILGHCTTVKWVDKKFGETTRREPITNLDDYWLGELIKRNAAEFGCRAGHVALDAVKINLLDLFGESSRKKRSWLGRPAVEDHEQNKLGRDPEHRLVDAFRDILLSWIDTEVAEARPYVKAMVTQGPEILTRIGIYCVNVRFKLLRSLVQDVLSVACTDTNLLHESYEFLAAHFSDLNQAEKEAVVDSIRKIVVDSNVDQHEKRLRFIQRRWLSAIANKGYGSADTWYAQLTRDLGYRLDEKDLHPSFHSYIESHWGFGRSPYTSSELVDLAMQGAFVSTVNSFAGSGQTFRGPTVRGLVDAVEEAVVAEPQLFIGKIAAFDKAKNRYKYALIGGAKKLWDSRKTTADGYNWDHLWKQLLTYLDELTAREEFWAEPVEPSDGDIPDRRWVTPLIADLLRAGTNEDDHSYPAKYLTTGKRILLRIFERADTDDDFGGSDPMTHAINSEKGRALEALISHALRASRVADRRDGDHRAVWDGLREVFDRELDKCVNSNFDFSTLMGAYVENLRYISAQWVEDNLSKLFPLQHEESLRCAIEGLAYAPVSKLLYEQLREQGVIIHTLDHTDDSGHGRENLLERIGLAYLWKIEPLDGPVLTKIKDSGYKKDAARIGRWFWTLRRPDVKGDQSKLIIEFWKWCIGWISPDPQPSSHIFATLGLLTCYIAEADDEAFELLKAVAPRMQDAHHESEFIEELARLAADSPKKIGLIVREMLAEFTPAFDHNNALKGIVEKVAEEDRSLALDLADKLRQLSGFLELYDRLAHTG